jgi:quinol monooxygenase YgiN
MTVTAFLDINIKPESLAGAPAAISQVLVATRAFPGNLGVDVVIDVADPAHFVLVEHWNSIDDDDAYRAFRATPEGASGLGELLSGPPKLTKFTDAPEI